ncbi:hypothetical protein [Acinetobacter sp. YH12128]|uniref:hypothetical protein n=1 Tax=Acinetobacter sp. YH12128 TaxID=2601113 RepID=UPI0015D34DBC|nr:hypothetical protein [Acinetobacter sp. YH12128]
MKNINNVKLIPYNVKSDIQLATMFCYFTVILFFNIMLYLFGDNKSLLLFLNFSFLVVYFLSFVFFKKTFLVLFRDWCSSFLVFLSFVFMYFEFGSRFFNIYFLFLFFIIYFLFDLFYLMKKNGIIIFDAINSSFFGLEFDYKKREDYRLNKLVINRSFFHKIFYFFVIVFFIFGFVFGKNLPYVFFGVSSFSNGGNDSFYDFGLFLIGSVVTFFCVTYVNILFLFLLYFIKCVKIRFK